MKILVITDKLYPDEMGGSCVVAYEIIAQWQKEFDVDIFTCAKTYSSNDSLFNGQICRNFNKINPIKSAIKLRKFIRNNNYSVIIVHSVYSWIIYYMAMLQEYSNSNLFAVFHGPWHKEAKYKYYESKNIIKKKILPQLMYILEKIFAKKNKNFIFLSKYMKEELKEINCEIENKNIFYISGGYNIDKYKRKYEKKLAKDMIGVDQDKIVLFILRRLDKRMGIDRVIEALKQLPKSIREKFFLIIGGAGNYRAFLEKLADPIKKQVLFTGFISDKEMNKYFCAADLFLVPSLDLEGFGLVNLESLAMGVPILATPQGGMVELNEKLTYFHLTKKNTIEEISHGIMKYGQIYHNKIIKEDNLSNEFSWEVIAKRYIEVFKDSRFL